MYHVQFSHETIFISLRSICIILILAFKLHTVYQCRPEELHPLPLHSLCCHLGHQVKGSKSGIDEVVTVATHLDGVQPVPHSGKSGIVWHTAVKQGLGYPTLGSGGRRREKEKQRERVKVVTLLPLPANLTPKCPPLSATSPFLHLFSSLLLFSTC